jgi:hypothetical protein
MRRNPETKKERLAGRSFIYRETSDGLRRMTQQNDDYRDRRALMGIGRYTGAVKPDISTTAPTDAPIRNIASASSAWADNPVIAAKAERTTNGTHARNAVSRFMGLSPDLDANVRIASRFPITTVIIRMGMA